MKIYTLKELLGMSSEQISNYILDITQTTIFKDKKYCAEVLKIWMAK